MCLCAGARAEWYCPACDMHNEGNFCEECGQKKASEEIICPGCSLDSALIPGAVYCLECGAKLPKIEKISQTISITAAQWNADGTVHVAWEDSVDHSPYSLGYQLLNDNSDEPVIPSLSAASGMTADLTELVPGKYYRIYVYGRDGYYATCEYCPGKPEAYTDLSIDITLDVRLKKGTNTQVVTTVNKLTAEMIRLREESMEYAVALRIGYPRLRKLREYDGLVTIEGSEGPGAVIYRGDFLLREDNQGVQVGGSFCSIEDYIVMMEKYYGGVKPGDYTVSLYFDGKFVASAVLTIGQ